ncbi:putative hydrolases of HD superfamily [Geoglobus ahangari]|uniref:5'-deoxynucleotidase n=1 Tax=Geoglobus ahangari TaxID=113653 RepID=A0A0F7IGQ3_9EURY|nr:HD domain-containing protein [Geoglobus ahangari]AKG91830.1 putative hydrolases of HD superfamily [Geoglobus ahangari]
MGLPDFLYESCSLKNVPRSGWFKVGIENPESVAEHSFLTAVIAFFLGMRRFGSVEEACKCATAALFHDLHEVRTLDLHRLAKRYADVDEERAREDQLDFPEGEAVRELLDRYGDLVRDADRLELFIQSRVYGRRCEDAMLYGDSISLESEEAKALLEELKKTDPRWWLRFEVHR